MGMGCGCELSRVLIVELSESSGRFSILWISATLGLLGPNFLIQPSTSFLASFMIENMLINFLRGPEVQIFCRARGYHGAYQINTGKLGRCELFTYISILTYCIDVNLRLAWLHSVRLQPLTLRLLIYFSLPAVPRGDCRSPGWGHLIPLVNQDLTVFLSHLPSSSSRVNSLFAGELQCICNCVCIIYSRMI